MHDPARADSPRLTLRELALPQKLLALVVLSTVGLGYLAALANLFANVAGADGRQTVVLEEIPALFQERGLGGVVTEIEKSLGKDDVVRRYHGSGAGVNRLEAALNGTMRGKILESLAGDDAPDEDTKALAEELRTMLIRWSHLEPPRRRETFEKGVPVNEEGALDWTALESEGDFERQPLVADTFQQYCASCHSGSGDPQARGFPLETFAQIDAYCVEDRGMSYAQLAMTTHVHLLGFSVLFAMTGFLFSLTSLPLWLRVVFAPWTLFFQICEIVCWWLAKTDVVFAEAIFYLGGVVGLGLLIQIVGCLADLVRPARGDAPSA